MTRIQKHFPLSVFVFIDSLVVSALQDVGGHTLFRQNNLGICLHVVGVRTVVRTLRHNQTFSGGYFTKFSYPWCSYGALRARASLKMQIFDLLRSTLKLRVGQNLVPSFV